MWFDIGDNKSIRKTAQALFDSNITSSTKIIVHNKGKSNIDQVNYLLVQI